jgi:hypothetical protein
MNVIVIGGFLKDKRNGGKQLPPAADPTAEPNEGICVECDQRKNKRYLLTQRPISALLAPKLTQMVDPGSVFTTICRVAFAAAA